MNEDDEIVIGIQKIFYTKEVFKMTSIEMVNRNHKRAKAQEYKIPENYTDHELRMAQLERKHQAEQKAVNKAALKYGAIMAALIPIMIIGMKIMIDFAWMYSYAVRGF